MIQGMSEICINCVHQEVCRYECYCPSGHCNDYAVADDFRPQGEWIGVVYSTNRIGVGMCNQCGANRIIDNYCGNCGAKMKAVQNEDR